MEGIRSSSERFRQFILNNRFVMFLLVLLLIGLNIMVFNRIAFIFVPLVVLVKTVLLPIILTGVVYYLTNPLVDWLEHHKIKRTYSIITLYLLIIGIVVFLLRSVIPLIGNQVMSLVDNFPTYAVQVQGMLDENVDSSVLKQLQEWLKFNVADLLQQASDQAANLLQNAWAAIGAVLGKLTEIVLAIATVPFILFYLLRDGKRLPTYILRFLPTRLRGSSLEIMTEMNHQISSYIRGQVIVSFCIGGLLYIGYLVIGLEYSLVLAIIAACTAVVPYLGPAIAITPALIVAVVNSPIMLLKMIAVWTVVQLIEGKFISPQIMGKSLSIHPITIIFVILTAGNLFGIFGIILAVPGYAVLKVMVMHLFRWFERRSGLYELKK